VVFWVQTPKPLLGVRFSHPLPFDVTPTFGVKYTENA